jgi:hypothetical protein
LKPPLKNVPPPRKLGPSSRPALASETWHAIPPPSSPPSSAAFRYARHSNLTSLPYSGCAFSVSKSCRVHPLPSTTTELQPVGCVALNR